MARIVAAGSILVDRIYGIEAFPGQGELTQIRSISRVPGGLVPNTGRDIRLLAPDIPVAAAGMIGDDDDGRFVLRELAAAGMDVSGVVVSPSAPTSFTDVMSVAGGERTFFTYPGASAAWGYDHFPFDAVQPGDIVLLGYFLLLAQIDAGDGVRILQELQRRGVRTAIDLVTENSDRYQLIRACLPFVDYLIVNETEAARLAGEAAGEKALCERLLALGVRERVVIHRPEKGVTVSRDGQWAELPSVSLPSGFIKGKTGAGDAFCAGCLVGIFKGLPAEKILHLGAVAAVGALSQPGACEGMATVAELEALCESFA
jgi:sugar/nucleoside kinase (ribokinase family)